MVAEKSQTTDRIHDPAEYPGLTAPEALEIFWAKRRPSDEAYFSNDDSGRSTKSFSDTDTLQPDFSISAQHVSDGISNPPQKVASGGNGCRFGKKCHSGPVVVMFWCGACPAKYCESCWESQPLHEDNGHDEQRLPLSVLEFIDSVYNTTSGANELEKNDDTKWFGVKEDEIESFFTDYGGYAQLAGSTGKDPAKQFPCLISFVGETGAGKSALIRSLVTLQQEAWSKAQSKHRPVMGEPNSTTPTSADVHIFADPKSFTSPRPLFYADCEGLKGGNRTPITSTKPSKHRLGRIINYSKVKWMKCAPGKSQRQWTVENLYPRVLFTFSDVVCFVTRNAKVLDDIFTQVIIWADSALERSVNQPILPHAIIVINACDTKPTADNHDIWDIEATTEILLRKHRNFFKTERRLDSIVAYWEDNGKKIKDLEALLMGYFSSVKLIYIPDQQKAPGILKRQNEKLYKQMESASNMAQESRKKTTLLMNSEDLEGYFISAWKHFSEQEQKPFNFVESALLYRPIPTDFRYHIRMLARQARYVSPNISGRGIFIEISELVASYIFLHAIREGYPSPDEYIFTKFEKLCEDAVSNFYNLDQVCERRNESGERCFNVAAGHQKGHQTKDGKLFQRGDPEFFVPDNVQSTIKKFTSEIRKSLGQLFEKFENSGESLKTESAGKVASNIHRVVLQKYVTKYWSSKECPRSHTTCFGCLSATPIQALLCGHAFCNRCLRRFSEHPIAKEEQRITVKDCPLCHPGAPRTTWTHEERPAEAGLRVLSLDGGGVRSIMQLVILERLEEAIGLGVPIHSFFDLIVGTSGGGIVALGLGTQGWSVAKCKEQFVKFSQKAFEKRRTVSRAWSHSKYKTAGFEEALRAAFGEDLIFGGQRSSQKSTGTKVAVTATCFRNTGGRAYLIANYRHQTPDFDAESHADEPYVESERRIAPPYRFFRSENDIGELKIWQAARATSAAPLYFRPFDHLYCNLRFEDGGLKMNNPVIAASCEMTRIWPEANNHPDLLLSLGTGFTKKQEVAADIPPSRGVKRLLKRLFALAKDQLETALDCNQAWDNFLIPLGIVGYEENKERYRRLNIEFKDSLPKFDSVGLVGFCQQMANDYCTDPENWGFRQVRAKLIASLFYFKMIDLKDSECIGEILCRLGAKSDSLRRLCEILSNQQQQDRDTFFLTDKPISSVAYPERQKLKVPDAVFREVLGGNEFEFQAKFPAPSEEKRTWIYLQLGDHETEKVLISGFPRLLKKEHLDSDSVRLRYQRLILARAKRSSGER